MTRRPRSTPTSAPSPAPSPVNLLIGTPAYGGMVHIEYVRSVFAFGAAGINYRMSMIGNESLITRARNTIISIFHGQAEHTHLLFLDADVHLPAADLQRMIAANVPVIGAPVALKGLDENGNRIWNVGRTLGTTGSLIKVENVGTAVLLLSRAACTALVEDAIANGRIYQIGNAVRGDFNPDLHYDVFQVGVHDGVYLSEDYWVCRRLHALGFDVLIDPTVVTTHHGVMAM